MYHLLLHGSLARYIWYYFCDIFYYPNPNFSSVKDIIIGCADYGSPNSMEKLCYTIVSIMIYRDIWRERNMKMFDDCYRESHIHMTRAAICKVRYWVIRISQVYTYQGSPLALLLVLPSSLGWNSKAHCLFFLKYLYGSLTKFYYLSTNGASHDGFVFGVEYQDMGWRNISNFFSYYGKGSNNYPEVKGLLDGLLYCQMFGTTQAQI